MHRMIWAMLAVIMSILLLAGTQLQASTTNPPTITFEKAVYFVSPSGDPVVVEPGTYEIEAAEEWLWLVPLGRERAQAILLQANVLHLDALLNTAKAESQQVGEDQHFLTLLLPDGTVLEAEGSYSGVQSRGLLLPQNKPFMKRSPSASVGSPAQGIAPRIITVTVPNANLVEVLVGGVNCGNVTNFGISAAQCDRVKADLRQRLKGYAVSGTGTPGQRVDLYLAPGCPAAQEFRAMVAAEVTTSVRARLGPAAGAVARLVASQFDGYYRGYTNVLVGETGVFESLLIAPATAQGVNVATPAGSTCSNGYAFARATSAPLPQITTAPPVEEPISTTTAPVQQDNPPQISGVTGPNANLVEALVGGVNCGNFTTLGISATQCEGVKGDLRQRLKGYAVRGTGTPGQRVDLYLAPGCPAAQEFTTLVAAEVATSVRTRLGPAAGAVANFVSSHFDGYWRTHTNVLVGRTGVFESILIAPATAQGVNVATPAGSTCSNGVSLPQQAVPVTTLPPSTTPPPGITTSSANAADFLARHNAVRASVAPVRATPLPTLTWNQNVADVAQGWANQCVMGHNAQRGALGENLFVFLGTPSDVIQPAVQAWAAEAPNYNYQSNTCVTGTCGHYMQIVWEHTTQLGCGIASCPGLQNGPGGQATIAVCNYSPPGNFMSQRPYDLN